MQQQLVAQLSDRFAKLIKTQRTPVIERGANSITVNTNAGPVEIKLAATATQKSTSL